MAHETATRGATMDRDLYPDDHEQFRTVGREFVNREVTPHREEWNEPRATGRAVWEAAGKQGVIGLSGPEEYGGAGLMRDYRFRNVVYEELMRAGGASLASGFSLQDDILIHYVVAMGTEEQKQRRLPDLCP